MTDRSRRSSPAISPAVRRVLARHRWIRWAVVIALGAVVAVGVRDRLAAVDEAADRWARTRRVLVATTDHEPGEPLRTRTADLPVVAIPPEALVPSDVTTSPESVVRQRVGAGEVIVRHDVARGPGPAALAEPGRVVVAVADPLVTTAPVGASVDLYSEGLVLATDGRVIGSLDAALLVAVDRADAPLVAAAAQLRVVSLGFPAD